MFDELVSPLLSTQWGRRLGIGIMVGMVFLMFLTLVHMLIAWKNDYDLVSAHPETAVAVTLRTDQLSTLIKSLPEKHLFGKWGEEEVPITQMNIHLLGIVQTIPKEHSTVIISEGDKPGKIYKIGDSLMGVRIYDVTENSVVFERDGRLEKLPMKRPILKFKGMPKPM